MFNSIHMSNTEDGWERISPNYVAAKPRKTLKLNFTDISLVEGLNFINIKNQIPDTARFLKILVTLDILASGVNNTLNGLGIHTLWSKLSNTLNFYESESFEVMEISQNINNVISKRSFQLISPVLENNEIGIQINKVGQGFSNSLIRVFGYYD